MSHGPSLRKSGLATTRGQQMVSFRNGACTGCQQYAVSGHWSFFWKDLHLSNATIICVKDVIWKASLGTGRWCHEMCKACVVPSGHSSESGTKRGQGGVCFLCNLPHVWQTLVQAQWDANLQNMWGSYVDKDLWQTVVNALTLKVCCGSFPESLVMLLARSLQQLWKASNSDLRRGVRTIRLRLCQSAIQGLHLFCFKCLRFIDLK